MIDGCATPGYVPFQSGALCRDHALDLLDQHERTLREKPLAPVIDIRTRRRVGHWSERYRRER